jgi:hypothetical protein
MTLQPMLLNRDGLALDVADFTEARAKRSKITCICIDCPPIIPLWKHMRAIHRFLLPAGSARTCIGFAP